MSIATGDPSVIVDGSPIARAGDVTTCGSKLIANQQAFAESGFDVSGIEQAAALMFPKVEAEDLAMSLAGDTSGDEPPEIGPDGLPILGSDAISNISIEQLDKNGNFLGNYRLQDNPSNLQASVAVPVPLQVPGALSLPKVPTRITTYPYTNKYDLQDPNNPFGKNCQDMLKKISNSRQKIDQRRKELQLDKHNLPKRADNLKLRYSRYGHEVLLRMSESKL